MTKLLITGGAGFIGRCLAPKILAAGKKIKILDSLSSQVHEAIPTNLKWFRQNDIEFIRGSVTSRRDWEIALEDVDMVVHLAAETGTGQSMYEIAHYNEINSYGSALMFDVLQKMPNHRVRRIILASSRSVYGEGAYSCHECGDQRVYPKSRNIEQLKSNQWELVCPRCSSQIQLLATKETDQILPASIYAATKYAQEDLIRISCEAQGIEHVIFRLQNVYGEGQSLNNPYTGLLTIFSTKIRQGNYLPLFEDGEESRDFVHVDDVTDALICGLFSETSPNTVINVGSGLPTTVKEVAIELSRALGQEPNIVITGQYRVGDIRHNYADIERLNTFYNFKPKINLHEGLKRFATWVEHEPIPCDKGEEANKELRIRKLMN